ncbi:hypothetical protein ACN4EK_06335 [Pantanalinema rosaneae CENA516]|uniref:hypothetical protein n=1 Tax=Pantanalinema rosaneae TaxID=1620701 RepID=UPI003D6EF24A
MQKIVLSTVGTSLLTQQIDRGNPDEKDWYPKLRDSANLRLEETPEEIRDIIATLQARAIHKLEKGSIKQIRAASAELNGIYGIYDERLEQGKTDMHWLISTDTAQGIATASIVQEFLTNHRITTQTFTPSGLSTSSTQAFTEGIDELLSWLDSAIKGYDHTCFNLVGGFKALQGYLNTIGMFYANELVYIFEGANSEVIKIPRLPIVINSNIFQDYVASFALMAAGAWLPISEDLKKLPESLFLFAENECALSNWGRLTWNQVKTGFLSNDLLPLPRLQYQKSFHKDYENISDISQRVKLQEVLAKVSYLFSKSNGDTGALKDDAGVLYEVYTNKNGIAHFRVTQGIRVSCVAEDGQLVLRRYGTEPEVNRNP